MCSLPSSTLKQYHFINEPKTWFEAQKYCRENYADLATIADPQDQDLMLSVKDRHGDAWIGLYDDISKWKWSLDMKDFNNNTDFSKWAVSNPNMLTYGHICVAMTTDGLWHDRLCSDSYGKICYNGMISFSFKTQHSSATEIGFQNILKLFFFCQTFSSRA